MNAEAMAGDAAVLDTDAGGGVAGLSAVLSRGLPQDDDQPKWDRAQSDLLRLSSNSRQMIAELSHHNIQWGQPEAAVAAIAEMLKEIRAGVGR
jgi:hypothetical protein